MVNEEGAKVVRLIYGLFITGKSTNHIVAKLTEMGIPTPRGNKCWDPSTIKSILHNEKYAGEAILQKTYSPDFLTKKRRPNNGEVPKYHVENSHEAIIEKDVFDFVQALLKNHDRRDSMTVFPGSSSARSAATNTEARSGTAITSTAALSGNAMASTSKAVDARLRI